LTERETIIYPTRIMSLSKKPVVVFLIALVSFSVYFNTFQHPFIYDDQGQIVRNQGIKDFQHLAALFSPKYFSVFDERSYRPMSTVLLMVQYSLWGLNPLPWRIFLLAAYIVTSWLVYRLARQIGLGTAGALTGALLFATHPVHAEPMNSPIFGYEIIALLFTLTGFFLFLRGHQAPAPLKRIWIVGSLTAFIAALGSKENALILPFIILLWEAFRGAFKSIGLRAARPSVPFFIISIPYILAIFTFFHNPKAYGDYPGGSFGTAFIAAPALFFKNMGLLVAPLPRFLTAEHTFSTAQNPLAAIVPISWMALGLILWVWFLSYRYSSIAFFSIGWILISFMPISNLVPLSQYLAERYLYFMSVGWALLIGYLFEVLADRCWTPWGKCTIWCTAGLLVALYAFCTIQRNEVWATPLALWTDAREKAPHVMRPHYNIAAAYFETGKYEEAVKELQEAIRIDPQYATAYNSLGYIYIQLKQYDSAADSFRTAIDLRSDFVEAIGNLGVTYWLMGRLQEALDQFQRALEFDPSYAPARNGIEHVTEALRKAGRDKADP
jgi:tetratricopeptide (TPR) repeat protein